jgi:ATPase family associated with various cellular activities (AAA)
VPKSYFLVQLHLCIPKLCFLVRSTFQKARSAAPSVIFLDEIEAIVGKRNLGSGGSGSDSVQERVLSTLLNEMDGVELASSVLVIVCVLSLFARIIYFFLMRLIFLGCYQSAGHVGCCVDAAWTF